MATKLIVRTSSDFANVRTSVRRPTGTISGAPKALQHAAQNKQVDIRRYSAKQRADGEEPDSGSEYPASSKSGRPSIRLSE